MAKEDTLYVEKVKKKLKTRPSLYHSKEDDYMILETDASGTYWSAVLKAKPLESENEKLCRYTSGTFKNAEVNYHSNDKEWLAVIRGIQKFKIYLISNEFLIRTDNKNFSYFIKNELRGDYKQGRLIRWQQFLRYYQFKVEHIKGEKNHLADCLTREFAGTI